MTLEDIVGNRLAATEIQVNVVNPEQPFGGVIIKMPLETVQISFDGAGGGAAGGPSLPTTDAVTSVFHRTGDVIAAKGDYTLDQIGPPVAMWTLPGKLRIKADGSLQLWNADQNKWHSIGVGGTAGGEYLTIGAGET